MAGAASAHAAKYAATGDPDHKQKALEFLDQAAAKQGNSPDLQEYLQEYQPRIRYRLQTREIIDKKEYDRRFPQGWKEEMK